MSEKIYTRLLRLYPSGFRKKYEGEALQLIRDRFRDEKGFFKRARLWCDLLADVLAGLPAAYRNSYALTEAASLSLSATGIPSFKILDEEPLGLGSILVGGTISLIVLAAFAFLLSRPIAYRPSRVRMDGCLRSNLSCSGSIEPRKRIRRSAARRPARWHPRKWARHSRRRQAHPCRTCLRHHRRERSRTASEIQSFPRNRRI